MGKACPRASVPRAAGQRRRGAPDRWLPRRQSRPHVPRASDLEQTATLRITYHTLSPIPANPAKGLAALAAFTPGRLKQLLLCHSAPCLQECPGESWNHGVAPTSSSSTSDRTLPSAADLCSRNPASPPHCAISSAGPQQVFQKHSGRRGVGWVSVINALPGSSGLRNHPKWLCSAAGKMKGRAGFTDGSPLWLRCSLVPFLEDVLVSGCPRAWQGEPRVLN